MNSDESDTRNLANDEQIGRLTTALNEATSIDLQEAIAKEIAQLGTESAYSTLLRFLDDKRAGPAAAAASGLGLLGNRGAVERLIAILESERRDEYLLYTVVVALGKLNDRRAVQPLIDVLEKMGYLDESRDFDLLLERISSQGETLDDELFSQYCEAAKARSERSYISRPWVIADVLGELGDNRAVEPLIKVLRCRTMIAAPVIYALGKLGDVRALPILAEFEDDETDVSRWGGGPVKNVARWAIENIKQNCQDC